MKRLRGALALGLVLIGGTALTAPRMSSRQYGIATDDPAALAFVRATGARDLVLGLALATGFRHRKRTAALLGWASLLGAADALILASARGLRPQLAVHLAGFALLALASRAR